MKKSRDQLTALAETPVELVERFERFYIRLASIYRRIGKLLGVERRPRRRFSKSALPQGPRRTSR